MQKTLGWDLLEKPFCFLMGHQTFAVSWIKPCPANIPAALEQLWVHGAHTCSLLIVWSRGFSQKSCTGGLRAVNISCRSGHWASAVTCRQVNTPTVIHPKAPPTSWLLSGKSGTCGFVWRHGMKLFSGSFDSKCLRKQGIQVEGADCILKIRQLVKYHGKFGPMVLLVASILWLNTVPQLQSRLSAWFTATHEYLNV